MLEYLVLQPLPQELVTTGRRRAQTLLLHLYRVLEASHFDLRNQVRILELYQFLLGAGRMHVYIALLNLILHPSYLSHV